MYNIPTESEIITLCEKYDIKNYTINNDLSIDVDGDVRICNLDLEYLPLKFRYIRGSFECNNNFLKSLKGSPIYVKGFFNCSNNQTLTSLSDGPKESERYKSYGCSILNIGEPPKTKSLRIDSTSPIFYLIDFIKSDIDLDGLTIIDRLNEFNCIEDSKLYLSRLNQLYDFYQVNFDESKFETITEYNIQ